jgi:hypothetical protein
MQKTPTILLVELTRVWDVATATEVTRIMVVFASETSA